MSEQKTYAERLLGDAEIGRWYRNVARGSKITATVYLRRLGNFCEGHKLTPRELAKLSERKLKSMLMDFVTSEEDRGHAGSYIGSVLKALKSWLAHNSREIKLGVKVRGLHDTPTLERERVPTKAELRQIFGAGEAKTRVASVLVAHSGLRLETLGNYVGDDGLRIGDLPELSVNNGSVEFGETPAMVVVRKELSKAGHRYFSFLSEEGCGYLKDYLEGRLRRGEEFTEDSPIITPKVRVKPFIRTANIGDAIRLAIRKAGLPWRPYVLRSFFDTQAMLAESRGLVLRDYRTFWMGHKGDIENRYTTHKGKLPKEVIDDMREAYRRIQEFLMTTTPEAPTGEEKYRRGLMLAFAKPEEIEGMDLARMSDEEFYAKLREKASSVMLNNGAKQKIVSSNEVEKHIAEGWEFVANLPGKKAVVRLPL